MEIRGKPDELDRVAHVIGVPICRPTDRSSHDSSLEGAGFELPVPRPRGLASTDMGAIDSRRRRVIEQSPASANRSRCWAAIRRVAAHRRIRRRRQGRRCRGDANASRNRKFESSSLQRRVSNGLFAALGAHDVSGRSTSHRYPMFNIRVSRNHNSRVVCGGRFAPQIRSSTMKQRQPT